MRKTDFSFQRNVLSMLLYPEVKEGDGYVTVDTPS